MDLKKITAEAGSIKAQVLKDAHSNDNLEDQISYIRNAAEYGCAGGNCNNLIYTGDCEAFYTKHAEEIDEMLADARDNECDPFESDYYKKNSYNLRNYLAWWAYEARAQELLQKIEDAKCEKCGEIHDVELAGGHDLIQADKILRCECNDHPDDEFCKDILAQAEKEEEIK